MAKSSMTVSVGDAVKHRAEMTKTGKVVGFDAQKRPTVQWADGSSESLRAVYLIVTGFAQS